MAPAARKEPEVPTSIAFDIYGTLVNPLAIAEQLRSSLEIK